MPSIPIVCVHVVHAPSNTFPYHVKGGSDCETTEDRGLSRLASYPNLPYNLPTSSSSWLLYITTRTNVFRTWHSGYTDSGLTHFLSLIPSSVLYSSPYSTLRDRHGCAIEPIPRLNNLPALLYSTSVKSLSILHGVSRI